MQHRPFSFRRRDKRDEAGLNRIAAVQECDATKVE
jgi:hypothetical protein